MVKNDDLSVPKVGDRVRIAWGLDILDGTVLDVSTEGPRGRAVVRVDLPGATDEDEVTVSLPLSALQPADWWPDSTEATGFWASNASYERHAADVISQIARELGDLAVYHSHQREDYDVALTSPRGRVLFEVAYFSTRARISSARIASIFNRVHRHAIRSEQLAGFVIVTNAENAKTAIERRLAATPPAELPVQVATWRSHDDDAELSRLVQALL